jgi:hypothetical protein
MKLTASLMLEAPSAQVAAGQGEGNSTLSMTV